MFSLNVFYLASLSVWMMWQMKMEMETKTFMSWLFSSKWCMVFTKYTLNRFYISRIQLNILVRWQLQSCNILGPR